MPAEVTIVHVPRERYGETRNSLESVLQHTRDVPYELLILDAASPPDVAAYLRETADAADNRSLLRFECILTPNELRNEAIRRIETPYIAFIDNDAIATPGWLEALLRCAREHDAWVVGPTLLIGPVEDGRIHLAGGDCEVIEEGGERRFSFLEQHFSGRLLSEVRDQLEPGPCTCIEFHCMLVRRDTFEAVGMLDEGLMSFVECDDFCMKVSQAGGRIYYTPESTVTYLPPSGSMSRADRECFLLRWSDEWNARSLATFLKTWQLAPDGVWVHHAQGWPKLHRRHLLRQLAWPLGRLAAIVEHKLWYSLGNGVSNGIEAHYTREVRERRARGLRERRGARLEAVS